MCLFGHRGAALVNYEAMASGLPVVTTHVAGSVVRDGVDGFVVPARCRCPYGLHTVSVQSR